MYWLLALVTVVFYTHVLWLHTSWHKERLFRDLVSDEPRLQVSAAVDLLDVRAQPEFVRALRSESPLARELAIKSLWSIWFTEAGDEANQLLTQAETASDHHNLTQALSILDKLVEKYPNFAEGWNRRAIVDWELNDLRQSIADCKKVVALNPNHFGAWHGMATCQMSLGEVANARQSMLKVLQISPHDSGAIQFIKRCDELLRRERKPRGQTIEI